MRFRFRLEAVLRVRQRALEARQRSVTEGQRALSAVDSRVASLSHQMRQSFLESVEHRGRSTLDVAALRGNQFFRGWLHRKIMDAQDELARRREELQTERAQLAEARKQFKVIETLRERRRRQHALAASREERWEADEVGLQRFVRDRRSEGETETT